ncbi:MAG: DUF898 family protein, partial [Duganella sp.]
QARFSLHGGAGPFYKLYAAFVILAIIVIGVAMWSLLSAAPVQMAKGNLNVKADQIARSMWIFAAIYILLLSLIPLFVSLVQNLVWNHAQLEQHRFQSEVKWGRMLFIIVSNYVAVICTLGLFLPFAQVRLMRYRIESLALLPQGSLDDIVVQAGADVGAAGEGVADFMDFDFSL